MLNGENEQWAYCLSRLAEENLFCTPGREFQSPALVLQGEFMEKDASFQTAKYSTSFGIVIYII